MFPLRVCLLSVDVVMTKGPHSLVATDAHALSLLNTDSLPAFQTQYNRFAKLALGSNDQ